MKIKLHKEGYPVVVLVLLILIALVILIDILFPVQTPIHYLLYLSGVIFYFFVVRFFRDPIRKVNPDNSLVISGADGKVVVIEEVVEKEYFQRKVKQVSIFMSPTNVHVNWYPVSGLIKYFRHNHGAYFVASKPKSSDENERTTIVIETADKKEILFRQIAGTVARRIVCYAAETKMVTQGEELGIIKFGSRFDLFLPLDAKIEVEIGQKVTGCETIIARF
jgi:phosphatidylserine decarboxylase